MGKASGGDIDGRKKTSRTNSSFVQKFFRNISSIWKTGYREGDGNKALDNSVPAPWPIYLLMNVWCTQFSSNGYDIRGTWYKFQYCVLATGVIIMNNRPGNRRVDDEALLHVLAKYVFIVCTGYLELCHTWNNYMPIIAFSSQWEWYWRVRWNIMEWWRKIILCCDEPWILLEAGTSRT